jgi:Tol biopolymer transport system component/DNA-binding winged helix-turn-helix (wHTH) protein
MERAGIVTSGGTNSTPERYTWGDCRLDVEAYRLERDGVPVSLEPKALDLLVLLLRRRGRLLSKAEIFAAVWPDTAVSDHALTRVVAQLRRALGDEAREARCIETVPTRGYRWIAEATVESVRASADGSSLRPGAPASADESARAAIDHSGSGGKPRAGFALPLAAIAIAALIVVAAIIAFDGPSEPAASASSAWPARATAAFPRQVTTSRGLDLHPSFGPDGSLAFASDRTGSLEIYVRGLPGDATDIAITSDGGQNVQPAWSPDGRYMAFHSAKRGGIWIVPSRGGAPRQIVEVGSQPAWSPDGTRLAFNTDELSDLIPFGFMAQSGAIIRIVNADGSGARDVTSPGQPFGWHGGPAWSPDGRRISFTSIQGGYSFEAGIWTKHLESDRLTSTSIGPGMYEITYARDGTAIYAAGSEGVMWRVPVDPATGAPLGPREAIAITGVQSVRGVTAGADGRLAFAGMTLDSQIWALPMSAGGAPAGPPRALTNDNSRRNSVPAIAPDGAHVAYMSRRHGETANIWTVGLDGRGPVQLTTHEAVDAQPRWLADSRRVAYFSLREQGPGLFSVDLETRRESLLIDVQEIIKGKRWLDGIVGERALSPDTRRLVFSLIAKPHATRRLYGIALDGDAAPRQLTDDPRDVGYPVISPDGRQVAVEIKTGSSTQLGIVPADGGAVVQLTDVRGQAWVRSWSADGSTLIFAALRDGVWSLRSIPVKGGPETVLLPAGGPSVYFRYPEWSAAGGVLVYERGQSWGNIFTLRP